MVGIGLRVYSNSKVYYTLIDRKNNGDLTYLDISHLIIPEAISRPEALNFLRNTILDILLEYNVKKAIIRMAEFGRTITTEAVERYYIEGVLQESLASSNVDSYLAGNISEITRIGKIVKTDFKKLANGEINFKEFTLSHERLLEIAKIDCYGANFTITPLPNGRIIVKGKHK